MDLRGLQSWLEQSAMTAADTRPLLAAVAKSLEVAYREHFQERENAGNARGFPPRHFWQREVARQMSRESDGTTARLLIASPAYAHKVKGGRITPKRGKALAIPLTAQAYATGSPRISGLPLVFVPDLSRRVIGWLIEHEMYSLKGKLRNAKSLGTVHYLLVPSVDQAADPNAEPSPGRVMARVQEDVTAFLDRMRPRAG
jgi:hypothetical protein